VGGAARESRAAGLRPPPAAGLGEFGENYVQEMEDKRGAAPEATWHFVGGLQRNKVHRVLELADVIHTLERGPAAQRLARLAGDRGPVDVLVEVDFTGRRVGVAPEDAVPFAEELSGADGVRVLGLMTVPPLGEVARPHFARLRELADRVRERVPTATELSMGMSADYEDAVEEGATMVRVGTAIFGPRP
jgi:PLP dependent protein